jgi:hypothetical protein
MVIDELFRLEPPEELFHYTSHDGLIGIAKNKELWASKAIFMNDAAEFRLALDLARNEIANQDQDYADELKDHLLHDIDDIENVNIFVASFSKKSDLLSQWRGYCSPGPGYSVGFRSTDLVDRAGIRFYLGNAATIRSNRKPP